MPPRVHNKTRVYQTQVFSPNSSSLIHESTATTIELWVYQTRVLSLLKRLVKIMLNGKKLFTSYHFLDMLYKRFSCFPSERCGTWASRHCTTCTKVIRVVSTLLKIFVGWNLVLTTHKLVFIFIFIFIFFMNKILKSTHITFM